VMCGFWWCLARTGEAAVVFNVVDAEDVFDMITARRYSLSNIDIVHCFLHPGFRDVTAFR